jgi:hypothetical protein
MTGRDTRIDEFCTIERTPARTRLLIRHTPAILPGPLTPSRLRARALRLLAREVAGRLNEGRARKRAGLRFGAPAAWLPPLALQQK